MTVLGARATTRATVQASAGPRVAPLLEGPRRPLTVVHRGHDAVYLDHDGWCLGVVAGPATHVPCALAVPAPLPLDTVTGATMGAGALVLDGVATVRVGRLVSTTVPGLHAQPASVVQLLRTCGETAATELGTLTSRIATHPEDLIGRGSGLTPLGDDVLAGWAATSYALGSPVVLPDARQRTTLLSATLLAYAQRGEVLPEFRALVVALCRPHASDDQGHEIADAAVALADVGHTSGAGLLLGAALRLEAP